MEEYLYFYKDFRKLRSKTEKWRKNEASHKHTCMYIQVCTHRLGHPQLLQEGCKHTSWLSDGCTGFQKMFSRSVANCENCCPIKLT